MGDRRGQRLPVRSPPPPDRRPTLPTPSSLDVRHGADRLEVLLQAPVAGNADARGVVKGLGVLGAGLVVEDLRGVIVLVHTADVLVHHKRRDARPHHSAAEGADLDDVAETLRSALRPSDEFVGDVRGGAAIAMPDMAAVLGGAGGVAKRACQGEVRSESG
eukprot:CAMPEP_0170386260 /NCGR_PEP_ID=MMETSP0117_2-20130122/16939_1 /TAXON_ID=400756 /ORGANISM="Durinskia baltica, Strain CSIRO CS-38" /LENGTH=160 /DNA_ID=CAMNT_0010642069 /DNA_START=21 /DNA_END=500 /DNA_ORIENTATION=-